MNHYLSPGDYLPHDAPMLLLEEVVNVTDETATCRVTVSPHSVLAPFLDAEGNLPGWFALELMAQTVGVWSGWHRLQRASVHLIRYGAWRARISLRGRLPAARQSTVHYR